MDDIFGIILYLLIFFLVILIQVITRKKQQVPVQQKQHNQNQSTTLRRRSVDFMDDWEEELSGNVIEDEELQILARLQQKSGTKEKQKTRGEQSLIKDENILSSQDEISDLLSSLRTDSQEIKKAIIYAEILNRKYF